MKFRTETTIPQSTEKWSHNQNFVFLGSCFATEMGEQMQDHLFPTCVNPLGQSFNPLSVKTAIDRADSQSSLSNDSFFEHLDLWRNFHVHSKLASPDKETSISTANAALRNLSSSLANADWLIVTLGTAWSYRHIETQQDVGHNHKLPRDQFERRLLDPAEISTALSKSFEHLLACSPKLRIVLTVSPVRHTRDGLHENNLSKSALLLATSQLEATSERITYFPAYEILIDELRDYRFFADDLVHPSKAATAYIWEKLGETYFDTKTQNCCQQIASIRADLNHRPSHPNTPEHIAFLSSLETKITALESRGFDVSALRKPRPVTI